jgi:hypothetical protein
VFSGAIVAAMQGEPVIGGLTARPSTCSARTARAGCSRTRTGWSTCARPCSTPRALRPLIETWTRERLPWIAPGMTGAVHSYEQWPPNDAYDALIKEYAASVKPA